MSDVACQEILIEIAFYGWTVEEKERVEDMVEEMVKKCHGSPLATKVLAGVLQTRRSRREWFKILKSEMWHLKVREEVFSLLALSYYDLPSGIRQCFQFCVVFPKDYKMKKDQLVKLWMAQGFLRATENKDMEEIGEEYFETLATRSFFQDLEEEHSWRGKTTYCKMHNLIHDFARMICKNECLNLIDQDVEDVSSDAPSYDCSGVRHLMVQRFRGVNAPLDTTPFTSTKQLRSFIAINSGVNLWRNIDDAQPDMYTQWQGIRSLVINNWLNQIPSTISQLIHLRHLDLTSNDLKELPEEVCELYNLEILIINGNCDLKKLPIEIGNKLVKLKHLENSLVRACLPKSIGRLTSLKTLIQFNIERVEERGDDEATNIEDLEDMNKLQGTLIVEGLGKVATCGEVKRAQFARKESLTLLSLGFNGDSRGRIDTVEEFLEAARPSTNLEELHVLYYKGATIFPSWLMSLSNLTRLTFAFCANVVHLPPLGALPSLEQLSLARMPKVKTVGVEFLGAAPAIFPKLKVLKFNILRGWEMWDIGEDVTSTTSSSVMPRLSSLSICGCIMLKKVPEVLLRRTTLKRLELSNRRYSGGPEKMLPSEYWDKISHITSIIIDEVDIRKRFKSEIESMSEIKRSTTQNNRD